MIFLSNHQSKEICGSKVKDGKITATIHPMSDLPCYEDGVFIGCTSDKGDGEDDCACDELKKQWLATLHEVENVTAAIMLLPMPIEDGFYQVDAEGKVVSQVKKNKSLHDDVPWEYGYRPMSPEWGTEFWEYRQVIRIKQ